MPLDEKQRQNLQDFLRKKIPSFDPCPLCKNTKWTLSDTIWEMREFHKEGLIIGGPIYPVISITCVNCGNTHFVNAIVAGIMPPEQKEVKNE
jgi:predicted nucleic-acid-binding Zn-ribbon protein